ncbi:MAG: ATP-grasp domain-containing protein [Janthinobacterium lividum]
MIKKTILFLLSPWRARFYDFANLRLPRETELLVISDQATLDRYIDLQKIPCRAVSLTPYRDYGYQFLSFEEISIIVTEFQTRGSHVYLHSDEEIALDSVAELNERHNLEGMGIEETKKYRNKYFMKQTIEENLVHCKLPDFCQDVDSASVLGFPLIGKPVALAGALGVEKINNQLELDTYFELHKTPLIIERFIEGDLYHCDGIIINGILQYFHAAKYFDPIEYATKHMSYIGSELLTDSTCYAALERASEEVVTRLGCRQGAVHIEFIVNSSGIYFVEIGNRPAGGYIQQMYNLTYGQNIYNLHLYSCYPEFVVDVQTPQRFSYCCGIYIMRTCDGVVADIHLPNFSPSLGYFNAFSEKWHGFKTNSALDCIGEVFFYSSDRDEYQGLVKAFVEEHKIIYKNQLGK